VDRQSADPSGDAIPAASERAWRLRQNKSKYEKMEMSPMVGREPLGADDCRAHPRTGPTAVFYGSNTHTTWTAYLTSALACHRLGARFDSCLSGVFWAGLRRVDKPENNHHHQKVTQRILIPKNGLWRHTIMRKARTEYCQRSKAMLRCQNT
jgi:hypothetical protein